MPRIVRFQTAAVLVLTLAALSSTARPQDLLTVAPQAAKVEYEDARIRVVRLHIPAEGQLPMHDRPSRVVITLTPNDVTTTRPDGTSSHVRAAAGTATWSEPARRSVINLGGALENVIVELKGDLAPAQPLTHAPVPSPTRYLDERFHRWLFENQYVRVYDVRIPPGETTDYHLHALDTVIVRVSPGETREQKKGGSWGPAEKSEPGRVDFSADSRSPRTHRVRNEGSTQFHVILVQILK